MTPAQYLGFSAQAAHAFRIAVAVVIAAQVLAYALRSRRFFTAERYGGYVDDASGPTWLYRPVGAAFFLTAWFLAAIVLAVIGGPLPALACAIAARYAFVRMRGRSLAGGMGAIGRMAHWLAWAVAALETASWLDASGATRGLVALVFRIDLGLILLSAGTYKLLHGYAHNRGVQYALANPWFARFPSIGRRIAPRGGVAYALNLASAIGETVIGLGLLIPPAAPFAAFALAGAFVVLAIVMRLGLLAESVVVAALLFVAPGSWLDRRLAFLGPGVVTPLHLTPAVLSPLAVALIALGALLPLLYAAMAYGFYTRHALPRPLQGAVDRCVRTLHLTLWRVVTIDYITCWVRIERVDAGVRHPVPSGVDAADVAALLGVFNSLRFFDTEDEFQRRLRRYARAIQGGTNASVEFTYAHFDLDSPTWRERVTNRFTVAADGSIREERLGTPDCREPVVGTRVYGTRLAWVAGRAEPRGDPPERTAPHEPSRTSQNRRR